jgi:hypothetical protein
MLLINSILGLFYEADDNQATGDIGLCMRVTISSGTHVVPRHVATHMQIDCCSVFRLRALS